VLCYQALAVAEIAKIETSPVLGLSGSHGYWARQMLPGGDHAELWPFFAVAMAALLAVSYFPALTIY
jgi:hypothetical protein